MEIELAPGRVAVVDDEDAPLVEGFRWKALTTGDGYVYVAATFSEAGKRRTILLHRHLLGVEDRSVIVDHRDNDTMNNRRSNLRLCTNGQNRQNGKTSARNRSGFRGVWYDPSSRGLKDWRGNVYADGKTYRRRFATAEEANAWCVAMRSELHGEFAYDAARDSRVQGQQ